VSSGTLNYTRSLVKRRVAAAYAGQTLARCHRIAPILVLAGEAGQQASPLPSSSADIASAFRIVCHAVMGECTKSDSEEEMLFRKSYKRSSMTISTARRHTGRPAARRESAIAIDTTRIARAFYCDVLGGRQVWDSECSSTLSFIVENARIDVSTSVAGGSEPVALTVSNPEHLAERCWDAGYSVRVDHDATGDATMSVIDPFGRRLELVR
jgi:hypothetical protein